MFARSFVVVIDGGNISRNFGLRRTMQNPVKLLACLLNVDEHIHESSIQKKCYLANANPFGISGTFDMNWDWVFSSCYKMKMCVCLKKRIITIYWNTTNEHKAYHIKKKENFNSEYFKTH